MTGILPGTDEWSEIYPELGNEDVNLHWDRLTLAFQVSAERTKVFRSLLSVRDSVPLESRFGAIDMHLKRSDVVMACTVGYSLTGFEIDFMDMVSVCPATDAPKVSFFGPETRCTVNDVDKNKAYDKFVIDIGSGVTLERGQFVELTYSEAEHIQLNSMLNTDRFEEARKIHKVRRLEGLLVAEDGNIFIEVLSNRDGFSQRRTVEPLSAIKGRVFAHLKRSEYEKLFHQHRSWEQLTLPARLPDTLRADFNWGEALSAMDERNLTQFRSGFYRQDADVLIKNRSAISMLERYIHGPFQKPSLLSLAS